MVSASEFLRPISRLGLIGAICVALSGCAATEAVTDVFTTITKADITVTASKNVNPDMDGRPSPILLRLYHLKSPVAFNNADFFALYDRDVAELGADYVNRDDLDLKPGETKTLKREFAPDTRYLGVIAAFRDIDTAVWKRVIEIEPDSNTELTVTLSNNQIQLTQE